MKLFKDLAEREDLDLSDGVYDWSIKATCILKFPEFASNYCEKESPMNTKGRFQIIMPDEE